MFGCLLALSLLGTPAGATSTPPVEQPLSVTLPRAMVGCDPVGRSIPATTVQVLSLVLPSAYVSTAKGTTNQADSFLVQAEVQGLSPLVVDYQIKPQAVWADGVHLGLADFLATWKDGASGTGPAAAQYHQIASISAPKDPLDVVVRFRHPTDSWQALFSPLLPASASQSALESCSAPTATVDLSAGPYVIVSSSSSQIDLIQNPSWWGTEPSFNPIAVTAQPGIQEGSFAPVAPLAYGQADWFTPAQLSAVSSSPAASSSLDFSNRLVSLDFATRGPVKLALSLRLGLAGLVDRTGLIASSVGASDPAISPATSHLISQGQPGYPSAAGLPPLVTPSTTTTTGLAVEQPSVNAAAVTQMHAAGYRKVNGRWLTARGQQLSLSLAVPQDDQWSQQIGTLLAAQLKAQGITITTIDVPGSFDSAELLRSGHAQLGVVVRTTDPLPGHAAAWFTVQRGLPTPPVWAGFDERTNNQLAAAASVIMNPVSAAPTYQQLDMELWRQMPSLPLLTEPYLLAWSSTIAGINSNPYPPGTLVALPGWRLTNASGS
jgi:peptide/nickel transport system substrate-binding protein